MALSTTREQRRPARRLSLDPLGAFGRDLLNLFELEGPGATVDSAAASQARPTVASPGRKDGSGTAAGHLRRSVPPACPSAKAGTNQRPTDPAAAPDAGAESQAFSITSFVGSAASAWFETVQTSTERAVENFMEITESVDQFVTSHLDEQTGGFLGPQQDPATRPYRTERLHKERHGGARPAVRSDNGAEHAVAPAGAWDDFSIDGSEDNDGLDLGWEGDENAPCSAGSSGVQVSSDVPPQGDVRSPLRPLTPNRRSTPPKRAGTLLGKAAHTGVSAGVIAASPQQTTTSAAAAAPQVQPVHAAAISPATSERSPAASSWCGSGENGVPRFPLGAAGTPNSSTPHAEGSRASTAGVSPPAFCPASPEKGPAEVQKYRARCEALAAKMRHFEASCERLQRENASLRARAACASERGAEGDDSVFMEQLAQQLQHVMQEKARLQRDKEALERDNCSLIELLEFAHGAGDGAE